MNNILIMFAEKEADGNSVMRRLGVGRPPRSLKLETASLRCRSHPERSDGSSI